MTAKENSDKERSALVKALREIKPDYEYLSKYWENLLRTIADSSPSDRTKLLKPFKSKRGNSTLSQVKKSWGRPIKYTNENELEMLEIFESVKKHYIKTGRPKNKRISDKEVLIIARTDSFKKKNIRLTRINSESEKAQRKTFLNRLAKARKNPKK